MAEADALEALILNAHERPSGLPTPGRFENDATEALAVYVDQDERIPGNGSSQRVGEVLHNLV